MGQKIIGRLVAWHEYILHDHIVGGDAISCDEQQSLVVDIVQVTHFAPGDEGQCALEVSLGK